MTTFALSSAGGLDDATLARAAATGDRTAFAAIYDRYSDRLYDFCVGMLRDRDSAADCVQDVFVTAATKLVQLREPDRLRSWLYAIARSEALARIRDRKREMPSEELPDMPTAEADLATLAARNELAELIAEASGGLSDRDRLVLELSYRQGLDGPELADALGVTHKNANTLVERLRDTIARSLGALLVCRRVKADPNQCPELADLLTDWDGQFTVLMRKRIARHIDGCAVCEEDRAQMVSPAALLGAAPIALPAPVWLRDRTLEQSIPGLGAAPVPGESWWPDADVDTSDLAKPPAGSAVTPVASHRRGVRAGLGAALVAMTIGAAVVLVTPATFRINPANDPGPLTTTATTTPSIATTTPSAVPRIAPPPTEPPPPPPVVTTSVEVAPTTEAPTPTPEAPKKTAPRTKEPVPIEQPVEPKMPPQPEEQTPEEPTVPEPEQDEISTPPAPSPSKPPVSIPKVPDAPKQGPECPPTNPACNGGGGPVFS